MAVFDNCHPCRWVAIPENKLLDPTTKWKRQMKRVAIPENKFLDPALKCKQQIKWVAIPENKYLDPATLPKSKRNCTVNLIQDPILMQKN